MIKLSKKILNILCKPYGINESQLKFLGGGRPGSNGIVYIYDTKYGERVLKVLAVPYNKKEDYIAFKERFEYAKFLVERGVNITYPLLNRNGKLYEFYCDEEYTYIAYSMMFVKGKSPVNIEDLDYYLIYEWGRNTGKVHKISKEFKLWKNISSFRYEYGFIDEVNDAYNKCKNELVRKKFIEIFKEICKMPINRDTYGFIHNDNHENNILVNNKELTLIDFECSTGQFFINDIVSVLQRLMFKECGGMYKPITNEGFIKEFLKVFIEGYRKENYIDKVFIENINTFINYRRLLVYVSMENYLDKNIEIKKSFLEMIEKPPEINFDIQI